MASDNVNVPDHVLRLPISNKKGEFCVINAVSDGVEPLDLNLMATEGESPYWIRIKHREVSKYLVKSSPISTSQWEDILRSVLLQQRHVGKAPDLANLDAVVTILQSKLVIVIRKNIEGIHQRLGEIPLARDEDQAIELLSWVGVAVERGNSLEREVVDFEENCAKQEERIKKLEIQVENMISDKDKNENLILERFRELLTRSKLKIRDQQRLLATSKVDASRAEEIQTARSTLGPSSEVPFKSRTNKRKVKPESATKASDSEDSSFQKVATDEGEPGTPERSDNSATDNDDDLDAATRPETDREQNKAVAPSKTTSPPPRRELPFGRSGGRVMGEAGEGMARSDDGTKVQPADSGNGDHENDEDDETSDDEL